jgi:hypothetical protein
MEKVENLKADGSNLQRYLNSGYRTVDGYLLPGAARLVTETSNVQRGLNITGNVAEIGVHEGRLLILLCLLRAPGERAVAMDLFGRQDLNRDRSGRGDQERLEKNLRRFIREQEWPVLIAADSRTLSSASVMKAAGGPFRIFSVDGSHEAPAVRHDLETAAGALCDGGVIVLDDYFNERWSGVADGTNQFFTADRSREFAPFAIAQNKVLVSACGYAAQYRQALLEAFKEKVRIFDSTLFGHPVAYFDFHMTRAEFFVARALRGAADRYPGLARLLRRVRHSVQIVRPRG